tara:strand:+ start:2853 stop:3395 length:543 start_codon:yes stop_codon:yes gene_type:complete
VKLIVGLGNPGAKYLTTRHNVGFILLDCLAFGEASISSYKNCFQGQLGQTTLDNKTVLLFKPMSYMNRSGSGVAELVSYRKIPLCDVLVIYDDIDLPWADVRYRTKGGHGGHNGVRDIINNLGSEQFSRLKIGLGRPPRENFCKSVADWVLSPFTDDELTELRGPIYDSVCNKVRTFIRE